MIYQTDDEFEPDIVHYGCYFLSLMWQLNRLLGIPPLEHKLIEVIYNTCKHLDANNDGVTAMQPECFISDPQGLVDYVVPGKVLFIGKKDKNYKTFKDGYLKQLSFVPEVLEGVSKIVLKKGCCLMCTEKEYFECHRSILAEEVVNRFKLPLVITHL